MEKIKKNFKTILIFVLVLFGMNRCTVSCNRGNEVISLTENASRQAEEIDSLKHLCEKQSLMIGALEKAGKSLEQAAKQKYVLDSLEKINRAKDVRQQKQIDKLTKEIKNIQTIN